MTSKSKMVHIHIPVEVLLGMNDKELGETITHPDGLKAARSELESMITNGVTCLVLDSSCNSRKKNGSCAGHPQVD